MSKTVRLYLKETDGEIKAVNAQALKEMGLDEDGKVEKTFGEGGEWHSVVIVNAKGAHQQQIDAIAYIPDEVVGFRLNPALLPAARCAVLIANWTLHESQFTDLQKVTDQHTVDDYARLPMAISNVLSPLLAQALAPSMNVVDAFFLGLSATPLPSETPPPSTDRRGENSIPV